jgi:hypothetical protein
MTSEKTGGSLENLVHWTVSHITDKQLMHAQLPANVSIKKKPPLKQDHW